MLRALSLFSGIGGLDLAASAAGIETVAFCEIEPFAVQVLERRFPAIENHGDITRFTNRRLRELGGSPFLRFKCPADYDGTIDVVHGGFPCQDLSVAGKQKGLSGERSGLWFEMLRVVRELRPAYVLAENVRGACNLALDTVYSGLVGEGYKVYPRRGPLAGRHEIANRMSSCAFELEIRDSSTPLRIVPREEGHSPALRSGEISEEERHRNLAGVRQLVAGVLGQ